MDTLSNKLFNGADLITTKLVGWAEDFILLIPNIVLSALVIVLFGVIARMVKKATQRALSRVVDSKALVGLTATVMHVIVLIVGLMIALNILNLERTVTSLLAGAGVIGLAIGFAFQDTAANFISGILLAVRKPFEIGDLIEVKGLPRGIVDRMNLRVTVIKTFQGQDMIVPNKNVFQNELTNFSTGVRRVDLACGISYGEDLEKVRTVALKAITDMGLHRTQDPVDFYYEGFGDSSINFKLRFWIDFPNSKDYLHAQSEAIIALKKAFNQNDITIPFPIRTLDFGIKGGEKFVDQMKIVNEK